MYTVGINAENWSEHFSTYIKINSICIQQQAYSIWSDGQDEHIVLRKQIN